MGAFALVQVSRLDGFLAGTRPIKQGVYKAVEGTLCPAPQNDAEGNCGTTLHFQFDTAEAAIRFEHLLDERGVYASRPIDSGRHVYSNWEFIMRKTSICDPGCAWDCPHYKAKVEYAPDMCPNTLEILSRTVAISTDPFWTQDKVDSLTDNILDAAQAM